MPTDPDLKRLHWRAHHRGTREADMLIGGFFDTPIQLGESIERVEAQANVATITTERRLLIFRTPTRTWEERWRTLR